MAHLADYIRGFHLLTFQIGANPFMPVSLHGILCSNHLR